MESPNSLYNTVNNTSKDGFENENIVIPSNFLISTKEIIARFPHNKRVGHYLLGRKLGEGSFAKVKEGLHTLTGQKVAIKVIDKKKAKEDAYVSKNMRREGKLLQMIIHPNIVQLYELMETENSYYLVTELCEGGDLMDYICARKYLSETCTRKFIRQIISAVDYLHRIGILHRDLKIENLLLDKNLNIKLIDFGLSNYTKSELCITQCGSPAYAAPELLAHKKYGSKVDVWSIGVNMYAMLTGNLPFTVEPFNIKSLYNKMMKNEMNPIPEHLSKSGEDLLRKLLNPDPSKRISLKEAMEHPWINEGYQSSLKPFPYPNKPTEDQVNPTILRYMNSNMEFNVNEVAENIKINKPSSSLATYYLLLNKVKTMLMKIDPKKDKLKCRVDSKPLIKDLKSSNKPTQSSSQPQPQPPQPPLQTTQNGMSNAQSPLPRTVKTPGVATNIATTANTTNGTSNTTTATTAATTTTTSNSSSNNHNNNNSNNHNSSSSKNNNSNNNNTEHSSSSSAANQVTTVVRNSINKTDISNKFNGSKLASSDRTVSPSTNTNSAPLPPSSTSTYNNKSNNNHHNNNNHHHHSNASTTTSSTSNNSPANSISGAIKSLTQKYKTLHLNNLNDNHQHHNHGNGATLSNPNSNTNNSSSNNNTNGTSYYKTTYSTTASTNPNAVTTAVNHYNHHHLSSSIDHGLNALNNGGNRDRNNSEHLTDEVRLSSGNRNSSSSGGGGGHLTNRNSIAATPTQHTKLINSINAEWTQMIRINTPKTGSGSGAGGLKPSDLNNNELHSTNNNSSNNNTSSHLVDTTSLLHLKHNSTNSNSSTTNGGGSIGGASGSSGSSGGGAIHLNPANTNANTNTNGNHGNMMPILNYQNHSMNNSSNSNHSSMNTGVFLSTANRMNKSPLVQKLSSPITLPAIEILNAASNNNTMTTNGNINSASVSGTGSNGSSLAVGRRSGSGSP